MYSSKAVRKKYPQKRRILRGWRRGGRIAIKAHEIASQNSFSIRFSQNFAYARVLSGVQIMISHANLGAAIPTRVPMRNLGAVSPRPAASPPQRTYDLGTKRMVLSTCMEQLLTSFPHFFGANHVAPSGAQWAKLPFKVPPIARARVTALSAAST